MKPRSVIPAFVALLSWLLLAPTLLACTAQRAAGNTATAEASGQQTAGRAAASYHTAGSLDELVAKSTVIVIGQLQSVGEVVNLARDPQNTSEPDPQVFSGGQVYLVAVQRYLKGQGPHALKVVQAEGFLPNPPATLTRADREKAKAQDTYIPLREGKTYLFFLRPLGLFPPETDYLTGTAHPSRFVLSADGYAGPESPWEQAQLVFPPRPTDQLLAQVEQLVGAPGTPTSPHTPVPPSPSSGPLPTRTP